MAPIRVGLIGLPAKDSEDYRPSEWGVQHLRVVLASPDYDLVAVCNSTAESAGKSIAFHKLDAAKVKAYGSPEDLAADPNVDLVVVSVSIQHHVSLAKPALNAGKDVYIEFPVAPTLPECEELAALAKDKGVKAMIGLQAFADPAYSKLRELVDSKAVGDVVTTAMLGASPVDVSQGWLENVKAFLDLDSGVSRVAIGLGHLLGGFVGAVGGFAEVQSVFKTQVKSTTLLDSSFQAAVPSYAISAPDTLAVQGVLTSGAIATIHLRVATTPVDDTGFRWLITGTKGEVELTTKPGFVQNSPPEAVIKMRMWGQEAAVVDWQPQEADFISKVPAPGPNIARAYDAFARADDGAYATMETAIKVHQILDKATKGAIWAP